MPEIELVEVEPNKWRIKRATLATARSSLPLPYVISDTMEPTEQVDGRFYTSKRAFRAAGRALGLIEVGNDKIPPKQRASTSKAEKAARRQSLKVAVEKYGAGHRAKGTNGTR